MSHLADAGRPAPGMLAEAAVAVALGSLRIRTQSFERVVKWALGDEASVAPLDPAEACQLRRAVLAWCRRAPWRALCMEQGVAIARLLAVRGFPVTLSYGAAMIDGDLEAHVWVRSGDLDILGCENAADFVLLSQFSNDSSSSPVQP